MTMSDSKKIYEQEMLSIFQIALDMLRNECHLCYLEALDEVFKTFCVTFRILNVLEQEDEVVTTTHTWLSSTLTTNVKCYAAMCNEHKICVRKAA